MRIGDAERDAAAADLSEHYAAGRLTFDELNERLDAVFTAKTFGQLAHVMTDLPGPGRLPWLTGYWPLAVASPAPDPAWLPAAAEVPATSSDRAGRVAALSLLVLAMLIWLFTALLFARQGFAHPGPYPGYAPYGPANHFEHVTLLPDVQPLRPPAGP
jgi:hypothetical protein